MSTATLNLTGFSFQELFHASGLQRLDERFLHQLQASNPEAHRSLLAYRGNTHTFPAPELSERLMTWAIFLEDFLIQLFNIDDAAAALQVTIQSDNPIAAFKKFFVLRNAKKTITQNH